MKVQVRQGLFETNSSSVHSITICETADYEQWKKGLVYINENGETTPKNNESMEKRKQVVIEYLKDYYMDIVSQKDIIDKITDTNYVEVLSNTSFDSYDFVDIKYRLYNTIGLDYDEWFDYIDNYEPFEKSKNGTTAFGYFGVDY